MEPISGAALRGLAAMPFIVQLLLLQMIPYLAGKRIRQRRGGLADRLHLPALLISYLSLVSFLVVLLFSGGGRGWWFLGGRDLLAVARLMGHGAPKPPHVFEALGASSR